MRKKRVLHLINTLNSGGAERQLVTYLRQAPLKRYENSGGLLDVAKIEEDSPANFLVPEVRAEGIEVIGLGLPGSRNWLRASSEFRRWLKANPVDLIHTNLLSSNIVGRMAGYFSGIPVLTTYHNLDYSPEATIFHFSGSRFKLRVMRQIDTFLAARACPLVIAVSRCVADHIHEHLLYPSDQIRLIYNPIDPIHMKRQETDPRGWVRGQIGVGQDARVLINVCRLAYQKNLPRLVDAFGAVVKNHPETHLVLLGSASNKAVYEEVCQRIGANGLTGHVHLAGTSHQVADWLSGSDAFVFPSLVEGMGIALAEAMSLGLPCVSSKVGPIPEFITSCENGILVDPQSTEQIAAAMNEILSCSTFAEGLGQRARETARRMFDPHEQAEKLSGVYEEIFARASGRAGV